MKIVKPIALIAMVSTLVGCASRNNFASNTSIVTRMAARDTGCQEGQIAVTELENDYAGISRYQTEGCGTTHNYQCRKWDNVVLASVGFINLDPRPCTREKR
jgi:hypothetical protein